MGKNFIGLDTDKTQKLADALNELLSNYQIFYMNVRGLQIFQYRCCRREPDDDPG